MDRRHSFDAKQNYEQLKQNQEKKHLFDNHWNSTQERVLQKRGEQALSYRWMHNRACKMITKYNNMMGSIGIIFGAVSGTSAFYNVTLCETRMGVLVGVCAYISTVSTALLHFLQLDRRASEHQKAATKFQMLSSEIINQLAMRRQNRKPGNEYMEEIRLQFNRIISEAPDINQKILDAFNKKFGEAKISKPDVANGIDSIVINARSTESPKEDIVINENCNSFKEEFEKRLQEKTNNLSEK